MKAPFVKQGCDPLRPRRASSSPSVALSLTLSCMLVCYVAWRCACAALALLEEAPQLPSMPLFAQHVHLQAVRALTGINPKYQTGCPRHSPTALHSAQQLSHSSLPTWGAGCRGGQKDGKGRGKDTDLFQGDGTGRGPTPKVYAGGYKSAKVRAPPKTPAVKKKATNAFKSKKRHKRR